MICVWISCNSDGLIGCRSREPVELIRFLCSVVCLGCLGVVVWENVYDSRIIDIILKWCVATLCFVFETCWVLGLCLNIRRISMSIGFGFLYLNCCLELQGMIVWLSAAVWMWYPLWVIDTVPCVGNCCLGFPGMYFFFGVDTVITYFVLS